MNEQSALIDYLVEIAMQFYNSTRGVQSKREFKMPRQQSSQASRSKNIKWQNDEDLL